MLLSNTTLYIIGITNERGSPMKRTLLLAFILQACISCGGGGSGSYSQSPPPQEQSGTGNNEAQASTSSSEFDTDGDGTLDYKDPFPGNAEHSVSKAVPETIELLRQR